MWRNAQMTPRSTFTLPVGPSSVQPGVSAMSPLSRIGRMHAELELLGHRDLDLRVFARRPEHAHALDPALRPDDGELLLAGILAGLREVGVLRELMPLAEQRLDVLLREVDVMRRNLDEKRLLLLRLEHLRDVGAADRAQRFARHHALLVGGHDEHRHLRVVGGNAADFVEAARVAVALRVERDAHALQSLQRQRATSALPWPMPPVKITASSPPIDAT